MSSSRFERPIPIPVHVQEYEGPAFSPTSEGDNPSHWPTSPASASQTTCTLASLSLDPHKDALSKQRSHSPAVDTYKIPAKIALEFYNKENGTDYELACPLEINDFKSDGTWVHCNFAAWLPKTDMYGISSRRLFFAEMHGDGVPSCTWTVTACVVLELSATTIGCSLCNKVIHPTQGFLQGQHKPEFSSHLSTSRKIPRYSHLSSSYSTTSILPNSYSPISDLLNPHKHTMSNIHAGSYKCPYAYPSAEQISNTRRKRAGIALDYYNKEKDANYELVDVLVCKCMLSGTWFHCNFTARPSNGDISSKLFFGEICLKTLTATACVILEEGGKTTDGCNLCLEVIHPTDGFVKGRDKNDVRYPPSSSS